MIGKALFQKSQRGEQRESMRRLTQPLERRHTPGRAWTRAARRGLRGRQTICRLPARTGHVLIVPRAAESRRVCVKELRDT